MNFHLAEVNKKNIGDNEDKGKGNKVKEKGNDFQKKKKKRKGNFMSVSYKFFITFIFSTILLRDFSNSLYYGFLQKSV